MTAALPSGQCVKRVLGKKCVIVGLQHHASCRERRPSSSQRMYASNEGRADAPQNLA